MRHWRRKLTRSRTPDAVGRVRRVRRFEVLESRVLLAGDVVMYNDHVTGAATHPFVTGYAAFGSSSGQLIDSQTGAATSITLATTSIGASYESVTGLPANGTDAANAFNGWIDFSSAGGASIALTGGDRYVHSFSGLSSDRSYEFTGTSVRGNAGYTSRWTLVTLVGADSFSLDHSAGIGVVTDGLPANQVALWTGENHLEDQGFVVGWSDIDPGIDGEFEVVSEQYLGATPGVGTGTAAGGSKGYALTAIQFVESDPAFHVVGVNPVNGAALTSAPTSYTVHLSEPLAAASLDASDLAVDGISAVSAAMIDSDSIEFMLPVITGDGLHTVTIAEGALLGGDSGLPISPFSGTFAILSGGGIVINEIGYDVGDDSQPWEFIELLNVSAEAIDISGWSLDEGVRYTLPANVVLQSGEHVVIAQNPTEFTSQFGVPVLGPFDGRLSNSGETIELRDANGDKQDEVDYQLGYPWPTVGDIEGYSIQLINPLLENDLGGSWRSAPATPNAPNSVFAINAPPQTRKVDHFPVSPRSGEDVTITVKATDPDGVATVALQYQLVEPGDYIAIDDPRYTTSWTTLPMTDDGAGGDVTPGDDIYTAVLTGDLQLHRRLVRYRVIATDSLGESVAVPYADDGQRNFAYFVYDDTPDWTGAVRPGQTQEVTYDGELLDSVSTYHLITTREAHEDSQFIPDSSRFNGYAGSDYLWNGALVYDGVVYDHIRYRARGGTWRYAMGKNMWKFDFNRGHDFQARDDYGETYDSSWTKLNLSAIISQGFSQHRGEQGLFESVGFKLFNMAGVASPNTNYVSFRIVESAAENGPDQYSGDFQGLYLAVEQLNDNFLEQHGLPDGNLYKMENGTGVGGIGGELSNQGDYPEVSDSSDLIAFKTTYESGPQTAEWWDQNLNLESYYSYRSILEAIHHYDTGYGKNYYYYHNPETDEWETLPWDLDLTWADNQYGNGAEPFRDRVLDFGAYAQAYRNRMREIRDLLYNEEQVSLLVDESSSFVFTEGQPSLVDADRAMWDFNPILVSDYVNLGQAGHGRFYAGGGSVPPPGSYAGMKQVLVDYSITRGAWIDQNILTDEANIPDTPTISYTGQAGFALGGWEFTTNDFPGSPTAFSAMEWRIAEVSNPNTPGFDPNAPWKYEIDAVWESGELNSFQDSITVGAGQFQEGRTYRARVRTMDSRDRWSHWSDPIEFIAGPPVSVPTLAITELHYHPNNPSLLDESDQEFIEILNTGAQTVDLSGVQITDFSNTPYLLADGLSLDPNEYIIVARNPAVFQSIYGTGINLAPGGYADANLSNGGETISLFAANGVQILSFTYDDTAPWPEAPDGDGPSLEIIDPSGDPNDPTNWRASMSDSGSPGSDGNSTPTLAGDYDRSGLVDQLDYQLWKNQYGLTPAAAGDGADGNADGVVDSADYSIWRDNLGASLSASPEAAHTAFAATAARVEASEGENELSLPAESEPTLADIVFGSIGDPEIPSAPADIYPMAPLPVLSDSLLQLLAQQLRDSAMFDKYQGDFDALLVGGESSEADEHEEEEDLSSVANSLGSAF
ncbi:CotH protein [Posidoniimonas polymericola]|uniref:CotH protein n=1 Tax=Posidoniimonas polymericola TaxID=2528002 RepID=A0A5C5YDH0_9BACT|nr:CotH protein [Posidoniimonas polymericola]